MMRRREFLGTSTAAIALGTAGLAPALSQEGAGSTPPAVAAANAIYDRIVEGIFERSPTLLTYLGLDTGKWAGARAELESAKESNRQEGLKPWLDALPALSAIDRAGLQARAKVDLDTVLWRARLAKEQATLPYGSTGGFSEPYNISQLTGGYQSVPDFLAQQHQVRTTADAEAYLSRLQAFARNLKDETDWFRADVDRGVLAPDFALDKTLTQLAKTIETRGAMAEVLARKTADRKIEGDWKGRADKIVEGEIAPALVALKDAVERARKGAVQDAGIWRLPDGERFYKLALKAMTTTDLPAEEIHRVGLEQAKDLNARMDALLKKEGMTQGSVAERLVALGNRPDQLYPNTDDGKQVLLADLNKQMAAMRALLPNAFERMPKAGMEVRRVPPAIEAGAPGGYAQPPTLDGSRPGAYYINLRNTAEWPRFTLPTLTWHEALPGHLFEIGLALDQPGQHLIRKILWFSAFGEGWALYAEQMADELGIYENDPLGRIGYLQSLAFRAARLVVDTGMHHKRWSREQAIKTMAELTGNPEGRVVTEIERYCVWPGQACAYKLGHTRIVELREKARADLGAKFDTKSFHTAVLDNGNVPLDVLNGVVAEYVAGRKG